jgi:ribulose 1,5-bisphosphate carboxylase large subunit-like protein
MPTELTIQAQLEETASGLTEAEKSLNRVRAAKKLVDDLSYSAEVGGRGLTVDSKFASKLTRGPERLRPAPEWFEFDIEMPDELFPIQLGGLQHLVGILAGDVLPTLTGTVHWKEKRITRFRLSKSLRDEAIARFRPAAHTIPEVRAKFNLPANRPLLAFSFKPRVGVALAEVKPIAVELAAAGFNIVEFDTRRLDNPKNDLGVWVEIQEAMTEKAKGPVAFSPNLSIRTDLAVRAASEWCERTAGHPTTLKVDGGLDGLSTIQAIRETIVKDSPIITCYPSLRSAFGRYLARADVWVDLLSVSGADIIYPGGRPSFGPGRQVSGDHLDKSLTEAQTRYREIIRNEWPMPSFAAGPQAGDLHVALHLLGGDTAMFLGEALTASRKGIVEAGRYLGKLVDATAAQINSKKGGKLPIEVLGEYTDHYPAETFIEYSQIFGDQRKAMPCWKP